MSEIDTQQIQDIETALGVRPTPKGPPQGGLGSDYLQAFGSGQMATPPEHLSAIARLGGYIPQVGIRAADMIQSGIGNLLGDEPRDRSFLTEAANPEPSTDTTGKVIDVVGRAIAPSIAAIATTGGLGEMAGMEQFPVVSRAIQEAAGFGLLGASQDRATAGEQAGEGAIYGLASALPRMARLPLIAATALGSKLFFDRNGEQASGIGDLSQGDLSAILGGVIGMAPGHTSFFGTPPKTIANATQAAIVPRLEDRTTLALPEMGSDSGQRINPQPIPLTTDISGQSFVGPDGKVYAIGPQARNLQQLQNPEVAGYLGASAESRAPDVNQLLGISPSDRIAESAAKSFAEPSQPTLTPEQQQATDLQRFRDARVIYAKDSPILPEMAAPIQAAAPITIDPNAIIPTRPANFAKMLFSPEQTQTLGRFGIDPQQPEVQSALQRLQFALLTREAQQDARVKQLAFMKFFADIHDRPDVGSLAAGGPLAGEDAWREMIQKGTRSPINPNGVEIPVLPEQMQNSPLPEATPNPQKGKIPSAPEYRRTEGGSIDMDTLGYIGLASGKAAAGALFGAAANRYSDNPVDPAEAAALGAALGFGAHVAPDILAALQKYKASLPRKGLFNSEAGSIGQTGADMGSPSPWHDIAAANNSEYQGQMGGTKLHTFKELSTGGNFSIKPENLTAETVASKAEAVRQSFTAPTVDLDLFLQSLQKEAPSANAGGGSMKGPSKEGGAIMPELSMAMGRAAIGGLVGGAIGGTTDDKNDHSGFVTGAFIGATAGFMAPVLAKGIAVALGTAKVKLPSGRSVMDNWSSMAKNWGTTIEEKAGAAFRGSDKISDRFAHWLDDKLEITLPAIVKSTLLKANGQVSALLDPIDQSLKRIGWRFNPDAQTKVITNKYLDGEFDAAEYKKQLGQAIANDPNVDHYANYAITARSSIDGLIRLTSDNLNNPKMAKIMKDSIGAYLTRSYKIFTNPTWKPTEQQIEAVAKEITTKKIWPGATGEDVRTYLQQYIREVKTTKGAYNVQSSPEGAAIGQQVLKQRKDLSQAWKDFLGEVTDPRDRIVQTVSRLRPMAEISKYFGDLTKSTDDGLQLVFKSYPEKDAAMNSILQSLQTNNSTHPDIAQMIQDYAAPGAKRDPIRSKIQSSLQNTPENQKVIKQLASLEAYQNVMKHPKFGELSGGIVNRGVWDTLMTFDSMTDLSTHPWLRAFARSNTFVKLSHTAFNPLTQIRNIMTLPAFMAIARVDPMVMPEAWRAMQDSSHPLYKELMEQGISGVDRVKAEFFREWQRTTGTNSDWSTLDLSRLNMGTYDLNAGKQLAQKGIRSILDFYRVPDNLLRVGAYISAKARIADALGKALDDPEVISKATDFTNRYTMNYEGVTPLVKSMRQIPLTNLFISFQAEMARLGKNLIQDVIQGGDGITSHGRMYAAIPLAATALAPDMLQSSSEASLSDKDRADWNKAKALLPDYSRNRYRWVTGRDSNGQFHYIDFTPIIHTDSFNQMIKAVGNGDFKAVAAINPLAGWENTPALNLVISQATGTDLQTKREFRYGLEGVQDRIATIAKEILPPLTPGVGSEAQRFQSAYIENKSGGSGITSTKTGVGVSPSDVWSSYFGPIVPGGTPIPGTKSGSLNLSVLQQRAQNDAKNAVANEIAYANDILKSDASDSLKQKTVQKARLALASILEDYRSKMGASPVQN